MFALGDFQYTDFIRFARRARVIGLGLDIENFKSW
jgi:hypothetical protein